HRAAVTFLARPPPRPRSRRFPYTTLCRSKQHVHFNGEPEQSVTGWRMDEGVGDQPPNLPMEPNLRAIEHRVIERASGADRKKERSEEHTSELQSRENLVCRLLLEKKK